MAPEEVHQHRRLRATVHERAQREGDHRLGLERLLGLVVLVDPLPRHEVDATTQHPPEVLVAPHHALGEPGGAAGVDDVDVVGAALPEVAVRALPRECVVPQHTAVRRDLGVALRIGRVRHHHDRAELPVLRCRDGDQGRVGTLVQQRHHVRVVEQVVQLAFDVAVVDVDGHGADLEDRQQRHDVLDAVLRVDPDVLAGLHPAAREVVRQPVGVGLELGVGHPALAHLDHVTLGDDVDGVLEEISDVDGHGQQTRTRSRFWLEWRHARRTSPGGPHAR